MTSIQNAVRYALGIVVLALAAACTTPPAGSAAMAEPAASTSSPKTALWVGNSFFYYNNSMHGHVGALIAAARPNATGYRATSATISGSGLDWQDLEAHFAPGGVGAYSFDKDNNVVFNTFDKPFDVVIMMDCSQCPIHPKLAPRFRSTAAKDSAIARRHGAEPIFFMSWAYADKPEMTEQLAAAYLEVGAANRAKVVPAGLAFARSLATRPDIELYVGDKRHPTLAGTYLAACTVLATVYGISPVGNAYTAGLAADVVAHLQATAAQTVQTFRQPI
jgi:hypothetical protein